MGAEKHGIHWLSKPNRKASPWFSKKIILVGWGEVDSRGDGHEYIRWLTGGGHILIRVWKLAKSQRLPNQHHYVRTADYCQDF